ncbi:MAG: hypothetical protein QM697_08400 [Lachnospiraceae bacterium]
MKKILKCVLLCGVLGWCLEIIFTAFDSFRRREWKLRGITSIWMFPIYGLGILILPLSGLLKNKTVWLRGAIYMAAIYLVEFLSGLFLKKRGACPWDYSRAKLNILGIVRLDYAPCWFITGLLFEMLLKKIK